MKKAMNQAINKAINQATSQSKTPIPTPNPVVIASKHVYLDRVSPDTPCALVIQGGRIHAVVPYDSKELYTSTSAQLYDFGDCAIYPGFHDAHQHVFHTALFPSRMGLSYCGTDEMDCAHALARFAEKLPQEAWVLGQGYRYALWNPRRVPTRKSLDEVFPARPCAMYAGDCHNLWMNSCAMKELGITKDMEPCPGGVFERDENGELTGVFREAAAMMFAAQIFKRIKTSDIQSSYTSYFERMLSQGVTSVCDMALSARPGADCVREDVYEALEEAGSLPMRIHMFPQLIDDFSRIERMRKRFRSSRLQACGLKQFFDGVSSAHTAWLLEPYENPYFAGDCGRPTIDPAHMQALACGALSRHIPVRIHAIGDKSVQVGLDIIEEARARYGRPQFGRNSLEHIENLTHADAVRFHKLGIVASVQPQHAVIDVDQPARDLGETRASFMWPFATFDKLGTHIAFGTDAPCSWADSREVIYCAITRKNPSFESRRQGDNALLASQNRAFLPSECISPAQAISFYTQGSASVVAREQELGSLRENYLADLSVWRENFLTCDPKDILHAHPRATFVAGELVWEA